MNETIPSIAEVDQPGAHPPTHSLAPLAADELQSSLERERALEREEHAAGLVRLRLAVAIGVWMWPSFASLDVLMATYVQPGVLGWLLPIRVLGALFIVAVHQRLLWRPPATPRGLLVLDSLLFCLASALLALMCVGFRGLESPYAAGIALVLVCRAAFVTMPWRIGLIPNSLAAAAYPLIVLGSAAFSPLTRAQLRDPVALSLFALYFAFILATAAFSVIGGHAAWSLRRQLFEARRIGRYRLLARIGAGGMGEVWSAHHPGLKRNVAIKILQSSRASDPVALRRFEREVHATAELQHPNTVRIHDYGVTPDGLWYYTMELLSGRDLGRLVAEQGPLEPARAANVVAQAARALAEAHARGIIHRDVKPENLFITDAFTEPDFVKVLDFGIAKIARSDAELTLTQGGWIGGTPAYISPEVAAGRDADPRSDVYGLAAVLYFALCGRPPFDGNNPGAVLAANLATEPQPPSSKLGRPLPAPLEAFTLRNLSKEPSERQASAADFARELAALSSSP